MGWVRWSSIGYIVIFWVVVYDIDFCFVGIVIVGMNDFVGWSVLVSFVNIVG